MRRVHPQYRASRLPCLDVPKGLLCQQDILSRQRHRPLLRVDLREGERFQTFVAASCRASEQERLGLPRPFLEANMKCAEQLRPLELQPCRVRWLDTSLPLLYG